MVKYVYTIPSNMDEYIHGNIIAINIAKGMENQWKDVDLFDSSREARIAWYKHEYARTVANLKDSSFDENGYLVS